MELLKYTLTKVSYAIVEPSYAIVFIIIGMAFFVKNLKISTLEKMIMGKNNISAFELTISQIVMGIFGGVVASIIFSFLGITFNQDSNIYIIFLISTILLFINARFMCLSYSGAILGVASIILKIISVILNRPELDILKVDIGNLMVLIGVMHIVEGLLVILDGKKGSIPVFGRRNGKLVGGFAYKRYWLLPMVIFVIMGTPETVSSMGAVSINTPNWWPILNHSINSKIFATSVIAALPIFAGVGYSTVTFTKEKSVKPLYSGSLIMSFGVLVCIVSIVARLNEVFQLMAIIFVPIAHEAMIKIDNKNEKTNTPIYISNEEGIRVLDVLPRSFASDMGLKSGDLILEINNEKVSTDKIVFDILERIPSEVVMKVKRANGQIRNFAKKNVDNIDVFGMVIVPREVPSEHKIVSTKDNNFSDILKKIKDKNHDDNNSDDDNDK